MSIVGRTGSVTVDYGVDKDGNQVMRVTIMLNLLLK